MLAFDFVLFFKSLRSSFVSFSASRAIVRRGLGRNGDEQTVTIENLKYFSLLDTAALVPWSFCRLSVWSLKWIAPVLVLLPAESLSFHGSLKKRTRIAERPGTVWGELCARWSSGTREGDGSPRARYLFPLHHSQLMDPGQPCVVTDVLCLDCQKSFPLPLFPCPPVVCVTVSLVYFLLAFFFLFLIFSL